MISMETARLLRDAGLQWQPALHDYFAIPDRGFDDRTFVISDMSSELNLLAGSQVVMFQGALEWTLDYVVATELLWIPREDQLRALLLARLEGAEQAFQLDYRSGRYACSISSEGKGLAFDDADAGECYAAALLYLLSKKRYPQVDSA